MTIVLDSGRRAAPRASAVASADLPTLLVVAWALELTGVACGVVNAALTTFPRAFPTTPVGWLPALPLVVLAMTELLRIPLAQAFQRRRSVVARGLALAALLPICAIAFENWTFGIERIVTLRVAEVEPVREALRRAERAVASAEAERQRAEVAGREGRADLQKRIEEGRRQQEELGRQAEAAARAHRELLAEIGTQCMKIAGACLQPRSLAEDQRYAAERNALAAQSERVMAGIAAAERALQALATGPSTGASPGAPDAVAAAQAELAAARRAFAEEANQNQVYRLAAMVHGVAPEQLDDRQLALARGFFSLFSAAIVSLAGVLAALIAYWPERTGPSVTEQAVKLLRGLRAWAGRQRRKVVRRVEVPVEKIVETVVEKIVPELVIEKPILVERNTVRFVAYSGNGALPEPHTVESRTEGPAAAAALDEARRQAAPEAAVGSAQPAKPARPALRLFK